MPYTPTQLVHTVLGTTEVDVYHATSPTLIRQIVLANTSAAPVTVRVGVVPAGGTAGTAHLLIPDVAIPAHDALDPSWWQVLPAGARLSASAATAGVITMTASGVDIP
jgi:hypothetical protein